MSPMPLPKQHHRKDRHHSNHHPNQQQQHKQKYILTALEDELNVSVLQPIETRDVKFATILGEFASFCLNPKVLETTTLPILLQHSQQQRHRQQGQEEEQEDQEGEENLVGEIQGGNDTTSIYRVSIPDSIINNNKHCDADMSGPVPQLFRAFAQAYYPNNPSVLTISRLREYLLQMCNDPRRRRLLLQRHDHHERHPPSSVPHDTNSNTSTTYIQLENVMLILSTGPISKGQVRHIDHIEDPNRQVCFLYMSENVPTTILYQLQEPNGSTGISNCQELMEFREDQ
jgi:hypothetical protein